MRFAAGPKIQNFLSDVPDFGEISALSMNAASAERQSGVRSELQVHGAGLDSMTQIKTAAEQARGIEAGGQAQAAATRAGGFSSMLGSIAGGIGSIDFGGGGGGSGSVPTMSNDMYRSLWPDDGL